MNTDLINKVMAKLPHDVNEMTAREIVRLTISALGIREAYASVEFSNEYSGHSDYIDYIDRELKHMAACWIVKNVNLKMTPHSAGEFTTERHCRFLCVIDGKL
jgi:hypothetical protein